MWDILPWDVVTEFRAQLGGGFGLVHKIQKKKKPGTHSPAQSPVHGGGATTTISSDSAAEAALEELEGAEPVHEGEVV